MAEQLPIRVLIADDHALFRDGLRHLLDRLPGIVVTGEAASGERAVTLATDDPPDVILMDINMPGISGIEALRRIRAALPRVAVVMLTMYEDGESVQAALAAGARGYVLKDSDRGTLQRAIEAAARGELLLDARTGALLSGQSDPPAVAAAPRGELEELTPRERQVLDLIARGHDNSQIAESLVISEKTVENHISSIFSKLGVTTRARAVILAIKAGMGS